MKVNSNNFISATKIAVRDSALKDAIRFATRTSSDRREVLMYADGHAHGEALRQQAAEARRRALRNLPDLLEQAEANMTANGIKVLWAADAAEARQMVLDIARQHDVGRIVKSKSMVTEEIALNPALEEAGLEVVETDLGEYIVQIAHEPPSHLVGPALHMSKETIRDLFMRELNMPFTNEAEEMTQFVRKILRERFLGAEMGISGGNFIIAETGTLCLCTNEGNGRMTTTLPPVHVAVVGIEKVVPTLEDYVTLVQVLPRSSTGQAITVYTQMINGPRRPEDSDGPQEMFVILVDNGRSAMYDSKYTEVLSCIRCAACLNVCPVYYSVGGHAYGWVYSGPVGAVLTPLFTGLENATPLPYASTLCGRCKEVCPVDIDLPRMLLDLRHDLVAGGHSPALWSAGIRAWAATARSSRRWAFAGKALSKGMKLAPRRLPGPLGGWTDYRELPPFAAQSFHALWDARQKEAGDEQS